MGPKVIDAEGLPGELIRELLSSADSCAAADGRFSERPLI
jgi:hypothetical protein